MVYTFYDHACGDVAVTHNAADGRITVAYERLEADGAIIPFFTVTLGAEHVAAWIAQLLTDRGRRCVRCEYDKRQLRAMLDRTKSDPGLVYVVHHGPAVVIVRNGSVIKTGFRPSLCVSELMRSVREPPDDPPDPTPASVAFARFARELIL